MKYWKIPELKDLPLGWGTMPAIAHKHEGGDQQAAMAASQGLKSSLSFGEKQHRKDFMFYLVKIW